MGAIPESLFESELFGHKKGAFTDAKETRVGRFEMANGGTLFLDEIANIPLAQQAKLLRVLESNEYEMVGSSITERTNIRLISASNANFDNLIKEEKFRADLFYRLNTIEIHIPSLRERVEDILPLADSSFTATVIRQATVYGFSKRMRFDLAINGMTHGAWETRQLPLMRDGTQWRPMIHVKDTSDAMIYLLTKNSNDINGEIFNVGSESNVYQLGALAERVAKTVGDDVAIEWYGDKDIRSYNVSFKKLADLGFKTKYKAEDGVKEILSKLESGELEKTKKTITLEWYSLLSKWHSILQEIDLNGTLINR